MLHWTIWGTEPEVHEASLRRYGSKLVYHITVYFLFTIVTLTCKYSILTQLTYHFASYNSCSNWRPPTSMQAWHRRTKFCRPMTDVPGVFWITSFMDPRVPTSNCSVEHPLWVPWSQFFKTRQGQCAAESYMPISCLHWGWWPSIWATVVRCKMISEFCQYTVFSGNRN